MSSVYKVQYVWYIRTKRDVAGCIL